MTRFGARWMGVLAAFSLLVFTSWADDRGMSYDSMSANPYGAPVHGIQWRWGPGGSSHSAPAREMFLSPLFPRNRPWGPNEYLIIGAGVVVTVVIIVLATNGPHHDNPPPP